MIWILNWKIWQIYSKMEIPKNALYPLNPQITLLLALLSFFSSHSQAIFFCMPFKKGLAMPYINLCCTHIEYNWDMLSPAFRTDLTWLMEFLSYFFVGLIGFLLHFVVYIFLGLEVEIMQMNFFVCFWFMEYTGIWKGDWLFAVGWLIRETF